MMGNGKIINVVVTAFSATVPMSNRFKKVSYAQTLSTFIAAADAAT